MVMVRLAALISKASFMSSASTATQNNSNWQYIQGQTFLQRRTHHQHISGEDAIPGFDLLVAQ